jgi:polyferredoxin
MERFYRLAADFVVVIHLVYVMVVVLGLLATWAGVLLKKTWARNFWWRIIHLSMILIVVGEAWAGMTCPLTTWENDLRELAGQQTYHDDFIARHVHDLLFYRAPKWVFTALYSGFGLLVVGSFLVAPPKWPRRNKSITDAAQDQLPERQRSE